METILLIEGLQKIGEIEDFLFKNARCKSPIQNVI